MTPPVLYLFLSYLVGSIPTGYWLGKIWKGINVRQHGSGNLGATNVFRVLGKGPGLATLLIDIGKGALSVCGAMYLFPNVNWLPLAAGLTAIIGHTASVFVHFRGGKGVATSAGVFSALAPLPCALAVTTFLLSFSITRIVSLSSMIAALALALSTWATSARPAIAWSAAGIALFVLWTHRSNIRRLLNGTEPRIAWKK